jgi:hypothetical protein
MTNSQQRRDALLAQAIAAEQEVAAYLKDANDDALKLFRLCSNWITDVRTFWLSQKADPINEGAWLDRAEQQLVYSLNAFNKIKAQVDQFGGPSKIATYPR